MQKKCVVIFPVYRSINKIEAAVFAQAIKMTQGCKHVFISPRSMKYDISFNEFKDIEKIVFDDNYFKNISGYNRLMLAKEFYRTFSDYDYMLIHQSDAYLFKPDLEYWINKKYDYIGAPWVKPGKILLVDFYQKIIDYVPFFFTPHARRRYTVRNNVGNGGLSLRKISSFIHVLDNVPAETLNTYITSDEREYNEDVFWSLEAPAVYNMSIPEWKEALLFSFETDPEWSYNRIGKQLPFGCHGFDKNKPTFWKKHISALRQENHKC